MDEDRKNKMQMRNLGDTVTAAIEATVTDDSVEEVVKQGIDTANVIEEGKIKQGFLGKLFRNRQLRNSDLLYESCTDSTNQSRPVRTTAEYVAVLSST